MSLVFSNSELNQISAETRAWAKVWEKFWQLKMKERMHEEYIKLTQPWKFVDLEQEVKKLGLDPARYIPRYKLTSVGWQSTSDSIQSLPRISRATAAPAFPADLTLEAAVRTLRSIQTYTIGNLTPVALRTWEGVDGVTYGEFSPVLTLWKTGATTGRWQGCRSPGGTNSLGIIPMRFR